MPSTPVQEGPATEVSPSSTDMVDVRLFGKGSYGKIVGDVMRTRV